MQVLGIRQLAVVIEGFRRGDAGVPQFAGRFESQISERILKSSISVLDSFNTVRNDQSFAHDNHILNRNESRLIFDHIAATIRFLEAVDPAVSETSP